METEQLFTLNVVVTQSYRQVQMSAYKTGEIWINSVY